MNSVTKICHSVKGLEPLPHSHLLCKSPACYHSTNLTHVRDRIFKLSPIHASMIIIFPEFAEFSESYAPFRKNPIKRVKSSIPYTKSVYSLGIYGEICHVSCRLTEILHPLQDTWISCAVQFEINVDSFSHRLYRYSSKWRDFHLIRWIRQNHPCMNWDPFTV